VYEKISVLLIEHGFEPESKRTGFQWIRRHMKNYFGSSFRLYRETFGPTYVYLKDAVSPGAIAEQVKKFTSEVSLSTVVLSDDESSTDEEGSESDTDFVPPNKTDLSTDSKSDM
jgi:hypothetical protein